MAFRQETLDYLSSTLGTGNCIQFVGLTGSGKSHFLRNLASSDQYSYKYLDLNFVPDKSPANLIDFVSQNFFPHTHLVLIFDHFDTLKNPNLESFFNWLVAHYQQNRGHLSYIFAVSTPLIETSILSQFFKLASLLTQNIYYLPPLSKPDSLDFIDRNLTELNMSLSDQQKESIYDQTGGYMQTIKRLIEAKGNPSDIHLTYHLECLYQNIQPFLSNHNLLDLLHLLAPDSSFSNKVLAKYISSKQPQPQFMDLLTGSELKAYQYLSSHPNVICSRDDLISAIWGNYSTGVSDHALDQIIHRLKTKLSKAKVNQQIDTLRGRGHRLTIS